MEHLAANARISINASTNLVWDALVNPLLVRQYLYGAVVVTDWQRGSPIVYRGEWEGSVYEDKGVILDIQPGKMLKMTHFNPLGGLADAPENYHIVTYTVAGDGAATVLSTTQENNQDQDDVDESQEMWNGVLGNIKVLLES